MEGLKIGLIVVNKKIVNNIDYVYRESIKYFRFNKRKLTIVNKNGRQVSYYFIVIENTKTCKIKITSYSRYLLLKLIDMQPETVDYHAKIVVSFLNYIFFEKYDDYKILDITDLKLEYGEEYLRDYAYGKIGQENKTNETIMKARGVLNNFYQFLYFNEYKTQMNYITKQDFNSMYFKKNKIKYTNSNLFYVSLPNWIPPKRIKSISLDLFRMILRTYDIYYPHLTLAICFQAFAGLRAGEVCNISKSKLNYSKIGDEFNYFTIDLTKKIQMRNDMVDVGSIKKPRIQPIHPVFLKTFKIVYDKHMKMIKNIDNDFGALFMNRYGEAITYESYHKIFDNVIEKVKIQLSKDGSFNSMSELNILMSGQIGTHVFRHFFTQFIAKLEQTKSSAEIAYWRGDRSLDSSVTYLSNAYYVDEEIENMQKEIMDLILNNNTDI